MSHPRARRVATAALFGCCLLLGGCQSSGSFTALFTGGSQPGKDRPGATSVVIAQGMELEWQIKTTQDSPGLVKSGKGVVGPDGMLVLGPYGACKIAGMPLGQASSVVEKHLAPYVKGSITLSAPNSGGLAWQPAKKPAPTPVAKNEPAKKPNGILMTAFGGPGKDGDPKKEKIEIAPTPRPIEGGPMLMPGPVAGPVVMPHPTMPPAPRELTLMTLPTYVVGPPDVLQIESLRGLPTQRISGPHLIRPDGTVNLGLHGSAMVAGMTLDQAKWAIAQAIHSKLDPKGPVTLKNVYDESSVDIVAYNSKFYYVITDGAGLGEQVYPFPITGSETVLDALGKIGGLPAVSSKYRIWVARRNPENAHAGLKMPVDWIGITQCADISTNYQIMPGDRVYVNADPWYKADRVLAKVLMPIERILGVTLLGSQTVNSIRNSNGNSSSGGTR